MVLCIRLIITVTHTDVSLAAAVSPLYDSLKQRVEVSDLVLAKVKASPLEA